MAALALAGSLGLAATPASAATVHPNTEGCFFTYNADGVYIRATPGGTALGEGYSGQTFWSYPYTTAYVNGLVWIHGEDTATGVSGWSAGEFLDLDSCHNYTP